jgi:hypothetical protein
MPYNNARIELCSARRGCPCGLMQDRLGGWSGTSRLTALGRDVGVQQDLHGMVAI